MDLDYSIHDSDDDFCAVESEDDDIILPDSEDDEVLMLGQKKHQLPSILTLPFTTRKPRSTANCMCLT